MLGLAAALRASGTLSPRSRVTRASFGGVAACEGCQPVALPELRLRSRVWVLLGEGAAAEPQIFRRWADCERLVQAQRRRLQGFPSEAEAKAFVAGAEQPWP